ncbi:MAG: hypothetical protein AAFR58_25495 [Cyanobacteria bacterium J06627_28]
MIRTVLRTSGSVIIPRIGFAIALSAPLLFQALPANAFVPHRYQVTDLGSLGGTSSLAYGLNEAGDVVGVAEDADGINRAFVWSDGTMTALPDLGVGGIAYDINSSGNITGAVDTGQDYARPWDGRISSVDNVALWQTNQQQTNQLVNLGNLGGIPRGEGRRLTDDGWIVGTASAPLPSVPEEDIWQRAFVALPGDDSLHDAGTFPGDIRSFIFDLNGSKQAPGFSVSDNRGGPAATQAGLWQFKPDGSVQSITPLEPLAPDQTSVALGINEAGEVVGRSATAEGQNVTVYWGAGQTSPELLPVLSENPGSYVRAWQINDSSLVVGELRDATDEERFATLWAPSNTQNNDGWVNVDLQTLIPGDSGWDLSGALSINNSWQIVGYGTLEGEQRSFLLTPTSVPEPGLLFGMGALVLLAVRLRKKSGAIDSI